VQAAERPFFFSQQFFRINSFPKPKIMLLSLGHQKKAAHRQVSARPGVKGKITA